jgi:succinate dehydrogenase/fumarate reductase flavoprotein subunit
MGEGASSSSADVSSNVEQQETVEDYVESSRSQEQSQKRSMEMEEDYSQESSVSAQEQSSVSAEEEYSATETSDTSQVASAESVSSSLRREFGFGKGKQ